MILLERLPQGFRNIQLIACPAVAQRRSKLIEDRIFDHVRRHRFGWTTTPSVLPRGPAHVVAIPPSWLGRVGGYHRSLAAFACQSTSEQRILWHASSRGPGSAASTKLRVDLLPHRRLHDRRLLACICRTPVFHLA